MLPTPPWSLPSPRPRVRSLRSPLSPPEEVVEAEEVGAVEAVEEEAVVKIEEAPPEVPHQDQGQVQGQVEAPDTLTTLPVVSVMSTGNMARGRGIVPTVTVVPGGTLRAPAQGTTETLLQALK